jgi:hypothetical protein
MIIKMESNWIFLFSFKYQICFVFERLSFKSQLYDEKGIMIADNRDICDCLRPGCVGCHYPCKKCKSSKCGNECRSNRTWYYEKVEIEGLSKTLEMQF